MESKRKKRLSNIIMVILILVIAASGILTVGKIQGWFEKQEQTVLKTGTTRGVVNIERKGIGYTLNSDTVIQSGDFLETKKGSTVELHLKENGSLTMNGNSEMEVAVCDSEQVTSTLHMGELFGDTFSYEEPFEVAFGDNHASLSNAVFSVGAQAGSSTLYILTGDVSVVLSDGTQERVEKGEVLSVVDEEDGSISYEIKEIAMTSLNEFLITQAQNCKNTDQLCFTGDDLQEVLDSRAEEKRAALEASLNTETLISLDSAAEMSEETVSEEDSGDAGESSEIPSDQETEEVVVTENVSETVDNAKVCTITILCDTILNNMGNLDNGKEAYVPANGTILATSSVEFQDGETVFDVLNRVCQYAGIQLEYSWTPMYDSYYIEGINNLYEFDCGNESGWMYKVNGWFPNYGCSSYYLEDGDNIVWCYTCNGLGADVGGSM